MITPLVTGLGQGLRAQEEWLWVLPPDGHLACVQEKQKSKCVGAGAGGDPELQAPRPFFPGTL